MKQKHIVSTLAFLAIFAIAPLGAQVTTPPPLSTDHHEEDTQAKTIEKLQADLKTAQEQVAEAQQLITAIQKQRDDYSKAYLDANANLQLMNAQLQAAQKKVAELTAPTPPPTPSPSPAAKK